MVEVGVVQGMSEVSASCQHHGMAFEIKGHFENAVK